MPRYGALRALGWFQLVLGAFYLVSFFVEKSVSGANLDAGLQDAIFTTLFSAVSGALLLGIRVAAMRKASRDLHEKHGLVPHKLPLLPDSVFGAPRREWTFQSRRNQTAESHSAR